MSKKIMFGSILSIFILFMLPSIPAVQYSSVLDNNKINYLQKIKQIEVNIKELNELLKNIDSKELNKKIKNIEVEELQEQIQKINKNYLFKQLEYNNQPIIPNFVVSLFILRTILNLINTIITLGKDIFFLIIDTFVGIFKFLISAPIAIFQRIISMIIHIIDMIIVAIFSIFTSQ